MTKIKKAKATVAKKKPVKATGKQPRVKLVKKNDSNDKVSRAKCRTSTSLTGVYKRIMACVSKFYLSSGDFNGLPVLELSIKLRLSCKKLIDNIEQLYDLKLLIVNYGQGHPNPHVYTYPIKERPDFEALKSGEYDFNHVCLYPAGNFQKSQKLPYKVKEKPYSMDLALGAASLDYRVFESSVLEEFRNDPRYVFENHEISGSISFSADEEGIPRTHLQSYGFAYDDSFKRAVAVFLCDLADLPDSLQLVWKAKEIPKASFLLHPSFADTVAGFAPERGSLFDAFILELQLVNKMCCVIGWKNFFRLDFTNEARPREFSFLLRPTEKEFSQFIHLLDKLLSDNIEKKFFVGKVALTEIVIKDGSSVEVQKGTIRLFNDFVRKSFRPNDWEPFDKAISVLRAIRNRRQPQAHTIVSDKYDEDYLKQQRDVMIDAYEVVRLIRLLFSNHPRAKDVQVPRWLFEGRIYTH